MQDKKPKVVFTFVEAGYGHIMPARAISDAFEKKYGDKCEIVRWNIFSDTTDPVIKKYSKAICGWTKDTSQSKLLYAIEGISYKIPSKLTLKFLDIKFRKAKTKIMNSIKEMSPSLMLSTYYSPSHFALECNKKGMTDTVVATYTPDPSIYPAWDRRSNLFFVNNQPQYDYAVKTGFKKDSLKLLPCVLRKEIAQTSLDKTQAKINLGLDKDKQTIVYASGAYGAKNDKKQVEKLLLANLGVNLVIICGKNKNLYEFCINLVEKNNIKNAFVIGFTDKMFEYLRSADLFLGKCGSNTMLEASYFGLPIFITACASPLETLTANYYVKNFGCKKVISPKKMLKEVKEFFVDFSKRENGERKTINTLGDVSGAELIADQLYFALKSKLKID